MYSNSNDDDKATEHIYCVQRKLALLGPLLKCTLCDFSQSSALTPPFQIPAVLFDQNRTIKYQENVQYCFRALQGCFQNLEKR